MGKKHEYPHGIPSDRASAKYVLTLADGKPGTSLPCARQPPTYAREPAFTPESGTPNGTRTRVSAVKGRRPRPLDDGRPTGGCSTWLDRSLQEGIDLTVPRNQRRLKWIFSDAVQPRPQCAVLGGADRTSRRFQGGRRREKTCLSAACSAVPMGVSPSLNAMAFSVAPVARLFNVSER